ncbi:MAG: TRAP transporter small permease subunit [Proteobacteria bacterium]|nr:TRAP transporter small permease subunit [Pseudomonadota bacterium]
MQKAVAIITWLNEELGKAVSYLLILMMISIAYEVIARYFFNRPTSWAMEVSTYLFCTYVLIGGGYTLAKGGHVSVDIVYGRFSTRTKAILACLTSVFFFVFVIVLLWLGWEMAYKSMMQHETSGTQLDWPLWPVKFLVPLASLLLLLQGLAKLITDFQTAITGRAPEGDGGHGGIFARSKE